ncbi:MAG: sortase, partial [Clostridia bacterium]|nr:sortase [Clostridia bacterium]
MKAKIIKINKNLIYSFILAVMFLGCIFTICIDQVDLLSFETKEVSSKVKKVENDLNQINGLEVKNNVSTNLEEYKNFPKEYRGYQTVGKIKIPKLEIEKYILEETTEESLKAAVTKTCGPKANEIGNFCISGHNYTQTFGRLKELEIGDTIIITDTYNRQVTYQVYKTYKVNPTDTSCLSQETNGEREVTLITCTLGAIKRTI